MLYSLVSCQCQTCSGRKMMTMTFPLDTKIIALLGLKQDMQKVDKIILLGTQCTLWTRMVKQSDNSLILPPTTLPNPTCYHVKSNSPIWRILGP